MKKILLLFIALIFTACRQSNGHKENERSRTNENPPEWRKLKKETLAVHDSAMVYMTTLKKLQKELQKKLEETSDEKLKQEQEKALRALKDADKGMWDWMHAYKAPDEKQTSPDSLLRFFQQEHQKIVKVHQDILNAIKNAEELLQKE